MKFELKEAAAMMLMLAGQPSLTAPLNTTTADTDISLLMGRSGCEQSHCPDTRFGVDIWAEYMVGMRTWIYLLRWQSVCGCHQEQVWRDGCRTFTTCTGRHSVCFDWHGGRGHWVAPDGHKTCWYLSSDYFCKRGWAVWPKIEVACTW